MNAAAGPLVADVPLVSIGLLGASVAFELAGALMLCLGAPPLAVLHSFAAFIVLAVVAAAHQLLPVLFRSAPLSMPVTLGVSLGFIAGFGLLIASFCGVPAFGWAGLLLGISGLTWSVAIGVRIFQAQSERSTAVVVGAAVASFAVAGACGVYMAAAFANSTPFPALLPMTHGALMILAFVSTFIIALSYRFVPMFSLSHVNAYGKRVFLYIAPILAVAVAAGFHSRISFGAGTVALSWIGWQHVQTVRGRLRKKLDLSLAYAGVAWCFAVLALSVLAVVAHPETVIMPVLTLAVLGWISLSIFGYGMKIAGFLSWQYARSCNEDRALPPLANAIPTAFGRFTLVVLTIGALSTAFVPIAAPSFAPYASVVYLCGSLLYGVLILRVILPYVRPVAV